MHKIFLVGLAALASLATVASAAPGDVVATGHIVAGGPHVAVLSLAEAGAEGVDGFSFAVTGGMSIQALGTDNSGLGYDLDIYAYGADGSFLDSCATGAADETCTLPAAAATAYVVGFLGADVDVVVKEI